MSEGTAVTTTVTNGTKLSKYEGDGIPFKGKLIGMEDLPVDRDEKLCLDSMFKLKAVVRARGEHKQKIQLNLNINAIKVYDDTTKVQIASHDIERVSFVVLDPRDTRAFGYIYNTTDDRHQFWAIKTERTATVTVLALKELFEVAFEQFTNAEKAKENQVISAPVSTEQVTVSIQQPPLESVPISTPQPPILPPRPTTQPAEVPPVSLIDNLWDDSPSTASPQPLPISQQQKPTPAIDLWGMSDPVVPVTPPAPLVQDPLADLFGALASPSTAPPVTQQSTSSVGNNDLFSMFTPTNPTPTVNTNIFAQPVQQAPFVPQQQSNFLNPLPVSPMVPSTVKSPPAEFDLLGDFS